MLLCSGLIGLSSAVGAQTHYTLTGEASTNSVDASTTIGAAQLKLKSSTGQILKAECGILGQLQSANQDGSFTFLHTLACTDHSLLQMLTRTEVTVQSACTTRPGIIGTFRENSVIQGIDGPFSGAIGQVIIEGTINCGFNDMEMKGSLTRP
jgi:hypothetical protein